ncbi:hypothetical protein ACJJTC_004061 [Scirpophaga incertulas]
MWVPSRGSGNFGCWEADLRQPSGRAEVGRMEKPVTTQIRAWDGERAKGGTGELPSNGDLHPPMYEDRRGAPEEPSQRRDFMMDLLYICELLECGKDSIHVREMFPPGTVTRVALAETLAQMISGYSSTGDLITSQTWVFLITCHARRMFST